MSKQGVTVSVPLHLFKDWAQDHKISVPNPPSGGLCISANGMTLAKLFIYKVPPTKTSVVFRRCTEVSQVINTNYAASYLCLQRTFVFTHQAISAQHAKNETLVTMMELVQKCSQTSPEAAKRQFAKFLAKSRAGKGWDYITCRVWLSYLLLIPITGGVCTQ